MVMQEGKIIELQEADELYKNPKNNYTERLIDAIP
jgi:peptide/nickel transport system ATP-binding protein